VAGAKNRQDTEGVFFPFFCTFEYILNIS